MFKLSKYYLVVACVLMLGSCIDEIAISNEVEQEHLLVVEAIITDELKIQQVKLSRTSALESESVNVENNATVRLTASNGNTYNFVQQPDGTYRSSEEFSAEINLSYMLEITTEDGIQYRSEQEQIASQSQIDDLYFERGFNENNDEGVSAFVNAANSSAYYRFEYEETYKIIAPLYSPQELIILNQDFPYPAGFFNGYTIQEIMDFLLDLQLRPEQEQICYNTVRSNEIILASTTEFETNELNQFRVHFVNRNNYIMSHRYSILVRQYAISQAAHDYYSILNDFSNNESIFSETQVGFLEGNLFSVNSDMNVVGYFEVSSVDEQRIYFNYSDLFPGEFLPPYVINCDDIITPALLEEDFAHNITNSPVIDALNAGFIFYEENTDEEGNPFVATPFQLVFQVCGDCTVLGQNVVPDFWEE